MIKTQETLLTVYHEKIEVNKQDLLELNTEHDELRRDCDDRIEKIRLDLDAQKKVTFERRQKRQEQARNFQLALEIKTELIAEEEEFVIGKIQGANTEMKHFLSEWI